MNLFTEKKFVSSKTGRELKYLYYSPNTDESVPLIIYLHGAGSRGSELSQLSHAGPIGELEKGRNIPARTVAPQCCGDTWFELFETLMDFAENMANESGGNAKITVFEKANHNAWDPAFALDEMWDWMFLQVNDLRRV